MNSTETQHIVLRNLITNDEYMRKVIPYLVPEYFDGVYVHLFNQLVKYIAKYNKMPTKSSFEHDLAENDLIRTDDELEEAAKNLDKLFTPQDENLKWLLDTTEKWCQDRALYNAIMQSFSVIKGDEKHLTKNALPDILQKALSVSFDANVGHDYIEQAEERFDFFNEDSPRIPFDVDYLNKITKDGFPNKTLNVVMAGPGVGKSLIMCHHAANCLSMGKNVLYITMEMAEESIASRIDANLFDIELDDLETLPKPLFKRKIDEIAAKTNGKLIIKEYPTGQAHTNHFRALLNELNLKKQFVPDIIFVDYLNICASSRIKSMGGSINSYNYIKSIAEEVRGLAVEFDVPIMSATQVNRTGYQSSDPGMEDTSESFGLPATADFMIAAVTNDELEELDQCMIIQLKNRYRDKSKDKKFCLGLNKAKQRIYDVDQSFVNKGKGGEENEDVPVFDNSNSGERVSQEKFSGFKT